METTTLDYLIPDLRQQLGDTDPATYRFVDEWLLKALISAVKALGRYWRFKYLIDESYNVYRNDLYPFTLSSPPVIEMSDERPIILKAGLIVKSGDLEKNGWNIGSWRDNEVSYSNIEGAKSLKESIRQDLEELDDLLVSPTKRLARPQKGSLPGYLNNDYEIGK